ncbi:MAG: SMI1/KNR4 family protein [Tepidibacter sp.]|jgi:hypothetical protein|uniref:SMI1/KNR4 family protein n=1 Tax=Tepidibacter sp. TaxID=2529387 RepID=UPI0025CD5F09|nr:SMI1/KNR4 family protein [Tepidibacter sp.]MCT4509936.1 SMI1/KNR4 family protein [Tepidibacter sp.]
MEQKLDFLRRYNNGNVSILTIDEIDNIDCDLIPNIWRNLFKENDIKSRINIILAIWKNHSGVELSNTISYLCDKLENIEMIKINNRYSILYTIKNSIGNILYYEGRNPNEKFNNEILEESWKEIPDGIRNFYQNVHNGFYYYSSVSMGLVPLESVTYLDDYEWGIIEELKEEIQLDLKTTFGFFSNGMGTYVAIDYKNCTNDNATLWSAKKKPTYNINFWDVVDEWIVIGFEV